MTVPVPLRYRRELRSATTEAGIPYEVGAEQITVESGFDPNAVSPAGAEGIAQFMPGTWPQYGTGSPFSPADAFPAYGRFMRRLMYDEGGDLRKALAGYNAGEGDLPAGYGYADEILARSGYTGWKGGKTVPYANPLRDVQGLTPERVDMGVDYGGTGPIYALGPGEITNIYNQGWGPPHGAAPGAFIAEKLSSGPLAGHYVYAAEGINPTVSVGQKVDSSTQIGDLTGGGIEWGFAAPPGTGGALGASQYTSDGTPTAYGAAASSLLSDLGAPPGTISGPISGEPPSWLKNVGKGLHGTAPPSSGGGGGFLGIPGAINNLAAPFITLEHDLEWWTAPSHWFRIFAGIAGAGFVVYGIVTLARPRVNVPVLGSTPVVPGGELGPALGIASVTAGAILLFFAFHNTGVGSWSEFLGAIRGKIHAPDAALEGGGVPVLSGPTGGGGNRKR